MKIPDKNIKPLAYKKWEEMDLLNANDIERILMLELDNVASFWEFLNGREWWDRKDMREFVKDVSRKIQIELFDQFFPSIKIEEQ